MTNTPPKADAKQSEPANDAEVGAAQLALTPERIRRATGTDINALQVRLLSQAFSAAWSDKGGNKDDGIVAILAALEAIAPADGVEGWLATQIVATHEAAMACLRRVRKTEQTLEGHDVNLKHAEKLLQIYAGQMAALDKRRGRGLQKVTIEHVESECRRPGDRRQFTGARGVTREERSPAFGS